MHPAPEMETTMKTAKAAPADRSKPDPLADHYGKIGISAVAAAATFSPARKPAAVDKPQRPIVTMD